MILVVIEVGTIGADSASIREGSQANSTAIDAEHLGGVLSVVIVDISDQTYRE